MYLNSVLYILCRTGVFSGRRFAAQTLETSPSKTPLRWAPLYLVRSITEFMG